MSSSSLLIAFYLAILYLFGNSADVLGFTDKKEMTTINNRANTAITLIPGPHNTNTSLINIDCSSKGTAVLMYLTNMPEWVCNDEGERRVTKVMFSVFDQSCKPLSSSMPGIMLDVGSNTGFYGLNALRRGCEAYFFDLQPQCQQFVNAAVYHNRFDLGRVFPYGVHAMPTSFNVPRSGCDGTFSGGSFTGSKESFQTQVYPLKHFIKKTPILMMKVDTEGSEVNVLKGASIFFNEHLIQNAIVEVTPKKGYYERVGSSMNDITMELSAIVEMGYYMVSLWDWSIHHSKDDAEKYLLGLDPTKVVQFDVWLTLEKPSLPLKELVHGQPPPILS